MPVPSQLASQRAHRPFRPFRPVLRHWLICALGLGGWATACNLTASDFQPVLVEVEQASPPPPDAGLPDPGVIEAEPDVCPGPDCPPVECESPECTPQPGLLNA